MPCDVLDGRVMDQDVNRGGSAQRPYPDGGWDEVIPGRQQSSIAVECYDRDTMRWVVYFA